jgi:putative flippase GtrA
VKALVFYKYKDLYSSAMEAYPYSATVAYLQTYVLFSVAIQPSMKASQQYLSTHLVMDCFFHHEVPATVANAMAIIVISNFILHSFTSTTKLD